MKEISTDIEIEASAERVWQVLTDFPAFPDWNPFMPNAEGELKARATIKVRFKPPKGMGMTIKVTVLKAEPEQELRWAGRLLMPGLFDGEHVFSITAKDGGGVRFHQSETFRGILVPLFALMGMFTNTLQGFNDMNQALKARAEASEASAE